MPSAYCHICSHVYGHCFIELEQVAYPPSITNHHQINRPIKIILLSLKYNIYLFS